MKAAGCGYAPDRTDRPSPRTPLEAISFGGYLRSRAGVCFKPPARAAAASGALRLRGDPGRASPFRSPSSARSTAPSVSGGEPPVPVAPALALPGQSVPRVASNRPVGGSSVSSASRKPRVGLWSKLPSLSIWPPRSKFLMADQSHFPTQSLVIRRNPLISSSAPHLLRRSGLNSVLARSSLTAIQPSRRNSVAIRRVVSTVDPKPLPDPPESCH